jgi:hypothetical protein
VRRRWAWKTPRLSSEAHGLLRLLPRRERRLGPLPLVSIASSAVRTPHASRHQRQHHWTLHQPSAGRGRRDQGQGLSLSACLPARHASPRKIAYPGDACPPPDPAFERRGAQATRRLLRQANPLLHSTPLYSTLLYSTPLHLYLVKLLSLLLMTCHCCAYAYFFHFDVV